MIALARALAGRLPAGGVVWLQGDLGVGKTTFVRAMVSALGGGETATSPTYDLVHRYQGRSDSIYHVDCYRLREPEEARDLDWGTITNGAALLIEWPERAGTWAPAATRVVRISHGADPERRVVAIE